MKKQLHKSSDKVIGGVCGGIAEYFDIDATVIRLATGLIFIFTGFFPMGIFYIFALVVMPNHNSHSHPQSTHHAETAHHDKA